MLLCAYRPKRSSYRRPMTEDELSKYINSNIPSGSEDDEVDSDEEYFAPSQVNVTASSEESNNTDSDSSEPDMIERTNNLLK